MVAEQAYRNVVTFAVIAGGILFFLQQDFYKETPWKGVIQTSQVYYVMYIMFLQAWNLF